MPFHTGTRNLPSPGSIQAANTLIRTLDNINSSVANSSRPWYDKTKVGAQTAMAYNQYNRSITKDTEQMADMSQGGSGRGYGQQRQYVQTSSSGGLFGFLFSPVAWLFGFIVWFILGKLGLQNQTIALIKPTLIFIWVTIYHLIPIVFKVLNFCADLLVSIINSHH